MAKTPAPFARPWLLPVALLAVFFVVLLLREAFSPGVAELTTDLPLDAAATDLLTLKHGVVLAGNGKVRIDDEILVLRRVIKSDKGLILPATNGPTVRKVPNQFQIAERGVDGTTPAAHGEGSKVQSLDTMFFPENNSSFGADVDSLFFLILWITGIAFILSEAFLLYCMLSFKARQGERSHYTHGAHRLEMFWTVATAVILVGLALLQHSMWTTIKRDQPTAADHPVKVQILAQQYKWFFRLPGNDDEFGTPDDIISGSLRVPQGRKIALTLRSQDVLHSFFLPNFRVKQDAVPGMAVPVWFEALKTGSFPIMCAELCGLGHTTMGSTLSVEKADEWQAWMEQTSTENATLIEDEETPRPEWQDERWWWWDRNPLPVGWPGSQSRKKAD